MHRRLEDTEANRGETGHARPHSFSPFHFTPGHEGVRTLILCDHASNAIPPEYANLGLPPGELARHIAWDIGAAGVARHLATLLKAPLAQAGFSRLLIDPNRGLDDPTLIMRIADGAVIPGNAHIDEAARQRRIERFWRPYDDAISRAIEHIRRAGRQPVLVSIHTFTPVWRGVPRPWHAGILHDPAQPSISPLLAQALRAQSPGLVIGINEPYSGGLPGDTLDRHGIGKGLEHTLVEIRQDLVSDEAGQRQWAIHIARALQDVLDVSAPADAHPCAEQGSGES